MDQELVRYYRRLLKDEFPNAGALDRPSVFVEAVGEKLIDCGNTGNFMELYLRVADGRIAEARYRCSCEPVANVAVEVLCDLLKGRTLAEAKGLTEQPFYERLESRDERLGRKVRGLLRLLHEGIAGGEPGSRPGGEGKPST